MIEGHGNDIFKGHFSNLVDFSSNVATPKPHGKLLEHLAKKAAVVANYPEPHAQSLRRKLAFHHDVNPNQIIVTNGSTEAFYLCAAAYRQQRSMVYVPSFSEYEDACRMNGHQFDFLSVGEFNKPFETIPDLVWLGNPNNPDGQVTSLEQIEEKLDAHPQTLFIIDEAYGELCSAFESAAPLVDTYENLLVVKSMTKLHAIPGLRLGYLLTSEKIAERIRAHMQPWSVNALAIEVGKFILDHEKQLVPDISELLWQSRRLQNQLSEIDGIQAIDSCCNYFLVQLERGTAANLKAHLLNEHGLLIRDASNFRGLDERYFRIAVQDKKSNQKLVEAIKEWTNLSI